mgnify:FL=1
MAKINMGTATKVFSALQYVVDKLAVKKPTFVFDANEYRDFTDADGNVTRYVTGVEVKYDAQTMGFIEYKAGAGRRTSDGSRPDAYIVESTHIKKERGRTNAVVTTNADVAVKTAVKTFAAPSEPDVCKAMLKNVGDLLDTASYRFRHLLRDIVDYNGTEVMEYFIRRHMYGDSEPLPKSVMIHKDKLSLYDKYLAGKQITDAVMVDRDNRKGYAVCELEDRSILVVHMAHKRDRNYADNVAEGKGLVRYRNFEDMPVEMQGKIAMLRIAQVSDPFMDIGIRLSDNKNYMYIIE